MVVEPSGWNAANEQDYQQALGNLQRRIEAAGPSDDLGIVMEVYRAMSDAELGRFYFLKLKAEGSL